MADTLYLSIFLKYIKYQCGLILDKSQSVVVISRSS